LIDVAIEAFEGGGETEAPRARAASVVATPIGTTDFIGSKASTWR
jgi:hypothetical protein